MSVMLALQELMAMTLKKNVCLVILLVRNVLVHKIINVINVII